MSRPRGGTLRSALANLRQAVARPGGRPAAVIANLLRRFRTVPPSGCCGRYGEPGC